MQPYNKWLGLLKSRKFWAAIVGIAFVVLKAYKPDFPINEEQLTGLIVVIVGYIFGTALEDGLSSGRVGVPDNQGPGK